MTGQRLFLLFDETLVLPELTDRHIAQLIEFDLLRENIQGNVDGPSKAAAALVIVEDGVKGGPVPIEEVLISKGVEIPDATSRVAQ